MAYVCFISRVLFNNTLQSCTKPKVHTAINHSIIFSFANSFHKITG